MYLSTPLGFRFDNFKYNYFLLVFRQGILKAGDRILKVNGVDVSNASQMETHSLLKKVEGACTLEIEYDVTVHGKLVSSTVKQWH